VTTTWETLLAQCEQRLASAEALLVHSGAEHLAAAAAVAAFEPPAPAGPLPYELAERARACAARGDALAASLAEELTNVRERLRRLPRVPRAVRETSFDAHA
jgi:hypothetical protein